MLMGNTMRTPGTTDMKTLVFLFFELVIISNHVSHFRVAAVHVVVKTELYQWCLSSQKECGCKLTVVFINR